MQAVPAFAGPVVAVCDINSPCGSGSPSARAQVVAELSEPFVPLPDDLLVNLAESRGVVEALLDSLPSTFAVNTSVRGPWLPPHGVDLHNLLCAAVAMAVFLPHRAPA